MEKFQRPLAQIQITVDVVIFTVCRGQLSVLLVQRDQEPFAGQYALPGGYLQEGELAVESAGRILINKAGVKDVYVEQLYTFDGLNRDPRGRIISVVYFALVPEAKLQLPGNQRVEIASVAQLPQLAFDHTDMVNYAVQRLRAKLEYTNVVFSLLPAKFTLSDLQAKYEAILGKKLDKRNFQKKFNSLELIEPTDEYTSGGKHRPARLFRFKDSQFSELKKFF